MGTDRPYEPFEHNDRPEHRHARGWEGACVGVSSFDDLPDRHTYFDEFEKQVDAEYRADAIDRGCERVRETEETVVTPAMKRIEAEDPDRHLVGLEFRLKCRDRLEEKVAMAMEEQPNLSADEAVSMVRDAMRYTFVYSEEQYTSGVDADCARLEAAGFEPFDRRNTWEHDQYKGINSRWYVPENDQFFEVQFHTLASFDAKQHTHKAYEKLRDPATSKAEQEELAEFQRQISAGIPIPPGATGIPDYRRST